MTRWLLERLIPAGVVVTVADLDDGPPDSLLESGLDVVLYLHGRGAMRDGPVLLSVHWRDGLVPGQSPPDPFWVRWDGREFVQAEQEAS
jgi:hypothetical protein